MIVGGMMNIMAVSTNFGQMPVYAGYDSLGDDDHFMFSKESDVRNFDLVDKYSIPFSNDQTLYYSVGDIFIYVFAFLMTITMIFLAVYVIRAKWSKK
jgi:hypothetical protein